MRQMRSGTRSGSCKTALSWWAVRTEPQGISLPPGGGGSGRGGSNASRAANTVLPDPLERYPDRLDDIVGVLQHLVVPAAQEAKALRLQPGVASRACRSHAQTPDSVTA